ncbi:MAG: hypothetical protein ABIP13_03400 [Tepidiformaceae bacterium]
MNATRVHVVIGDDALRIALAARVRRGADLVVAPLSTGFSGLTVGGVVLTTPADCSLLLCGELVSRGLGVVVLTPMSREIERAAYGLAGGRYIEMQVNTEELFEALAEAPRGQPTLG